MTGIWLSARAGLDAAPARTAAAIAGPRISRAGVDRAAEREEAVPIGHLRRPGADAELPMAAELEAGHLRPVTGGGR